MGPARRLRRSGIAILGAWLAACSTNTGPVGIARGQALVLYNQDSGRTLSVAVGDEIDITLQTIPGYGRYATPDISSRSLVFLGVSDGPVNPGGPIQLYRFEAAAPGTAVVSIPHTTDRAPFGVTVNVHSGTVATQLDWY
jgi:hypothetical protein